MGITAPELLTDQHNIQEFNCGKPSLDDWLKNTALKGQDEGGARTFVVTDTVTTRVVGYYCIASGSIEREQAPGKVRRNMPDPIPVILLGRLAVQSAYARQGLGRGMMKDCYLRVTKVSDVVGVRALLVHALDQESREYYLPQGFSESPLSPNALMLTVKDIRAHLR
jgi:GNAT superfamily N-acetyltransferase